MKHVVGFELHQPTISSLNYMTIGGYSKSVVEKPKDIIWASSYCSKHWEIFIHSLQFADTMIVEKDYGLRARISIEEKGIIV
jgi:hypothetical protein